jgi:hypothetical protein
MNETPGLQDEKEVGDKLTAPHHHWRKRFRVWGLACRGSGFG